LAFTAAGSGQLSSSNVEVDQLLVAGSTISSLTTDIIVSASGVRKIVMATIQVDNVLAGNNAITVVHSNGNLNLNTEQTETVIFGPSLQNGNLKIDGSEISFADDIYINPSAAGKVVLGQLLEIDNVQLDGNAISVSDTGGNLSVVPSGNGHVVFNSPFNANLLTINGEVISSEENVMLSPGAAGKVKIAGKDMLVRNNLKVLGNTVVGTQGNMVLAPAGNSAVVGDIDAGSDDLVLNASSAVFFNSLTLDHMKIFDSTISTKDTNVNLYLRAEGDGVVVFDRSFRANEILLNGSTLSTTTLNSDLTVDPHGAGKAVFANLLVDNVFLSNSTLTNSIEGEDLILTANGMVNVTDEVLVDNLVIRGNSLTSTDSNGNINVMPEGSGMVVLENLSSAASFDLMLTTSNTHTSGTVVSSMFEQQSILFNGADTISTTADVSNTNLKLAAAGAGKLIVKTLSITSPSSQDLNLVVGAGQKVVIGETVQMDQMQFDANTLSTTNADGNLVLHANGANISLIARAKVASGIILDGGSISSASSNQNVVLDPSGKVVVSNAVKLNGNTFVTGSMKADNLLVDATALSATDADGNIELTPAASSAVVLKSIDGIGPITLQPPVGQDVSFGEAVQVDNLHFDGSTMSSTDSNGDIKFSPAGTGSVVSENEVTVGQLQLNGNNLTGASGNILIAPDVNGTVVLGNNASIDSIVLDGNSVSTRSGDLVLAAGSGNKIFIESLKVPTFETSTSDLNISTDVIATSTNTDLVLSSTGTGLVNTGKTSMTILTMNNNLNLSTIGVGTTSGDLNLTPYGSTVIAPATTVGSLIVDHFTVTGAGLTATDGVDITLNASGSVVFSEIESTTSFQASNIVFDGSTVSTTTDKDIILTPHGRGSVVANAMGGVEVAHFKFENESLAMTVTDGDVTLAATKLVVDQHSTAVDNLVIVNNTISTSDADGTITLGHENYVDSSESSVKATQGMVFTGSNGAKLSMINNTIATIGNNTDLELSGQNPLTDKVFLHGVDATKNIKAYSGDLVMTAGPTGNIMIIPGSGATKNVVIGGFHIDENLLYTDQNYVRPMLTLEPASDSNILFTTSGTGSVAIGSAATMASATSWKPNPSATLEVGGRVSAMHYLVDTYSLAATSSTNYAPLSSFSASSFSDIGLSKTFTLTSPAVVMVHYSLATTFRTSSAVDTVGVQVSSLFLATSGSESEEGAGRSAQGYQATGTDSADVTQTSNMATNTGMLMKSLAAGTHTFKVKTKHVMCGVDCSAGYTDDLPNDPTSSTYYDARSIQVIVLGSQIPL